MCSIGFTGRLSTVVTLLSLSLLLVLAGCAAAPAAAPTPSALSGVPWLVDRLTTAGAEVTESGEEQSPFIPVPGTSLSVNGQPVKVYAFSTAEEAAAFAGTISETGSGVGPAQVHFIASPHWYRAANLVVLYTGDDTNTQSLLSSILGGQFAGL